MNTKPAKPTRVASHTPTPWALSVCGTDVISAHGLFIADCERRKNREEGEANAAFIVRAVNAHEALTECVRKARGYVADYCMRFPTLSGSAKEMLHKIEQALALAGEAVTKEQGGGE